MKNHNMKTILAIVALCVTSSLRLVAQPFPAFSTNIVVVPQTNGSVNVQWTPSPSTNVNTIVYVGVVSGVYNISITVSNGGVANIPGLAPGGTYYFRVRAKDRTSGIESDPSNEVSYQVTKPQPTGQDLRTVMFTPVLEGTEFIGGLYTEVLRWPTKTILPESRARFFRQRMDTSEGPAIRKL
jgi:hypothetical protein